MAIMRVVMLICKWLLLTIGAGTVLAYGLPPLIRLLPQLEVPDKDVRELPSPDGAFTAVMTTEAGGGGISPFCSNTVAIVPNGVPASEGLSIKYKVFVEQCGPRSPVVDWETASKLSIRYDPPDTPADYLGNIELRRHDASRKVDVMFLIRPPECT